MNAVRTEKAHQNQDVVATAVRKLWPGARWEVEPLADGMTNRNYKVQVHPAGEESRTVVIQEQLPPGPAYDIGILRENQMVIWPQMTEIGLAPELIAMFDDIGVIIVEFVEGTRLTDVEDRELGIRLTARALARLHDYTKGMRTPGLISDPFTSVTWLAGQIHAQVPMVVEEFAWALDLVNRIQAARGPYEQCQLHTDATPVNIFVAPEEDRVTLIDWEYVGAGDRFFDLAHFANRFSLTEAEVERLLISYEGALDSRSLAIVHVYRFIDMLRESLWSTSASYAGFVEDFDHDQYAQEWRQKMPAMAVSSVFEASLALLEATSNWSAR